MNKRCLPWMKGHDAWNIPSTSMKGGERVPALLVQHVLPACEKPERWICPALHLLVSIESVRNKDTAACECERKRIMPKRPR